MDRHSRKGQQCVVADLHLAEVLGYFEVRNAVILSLHYFFDLEPNRFSLVKLRVLVLQEQCTCKQDPC